MRAVYVDATTLIALGGVDELSILDTIDDELIVLPSVRAEVTSEPARENLATFSHGRSVREESPVEPLVKRAQDVLEEPHVNGDVDIIGAVLAHRNADQDVAVVSDDRRIRSVARGVGATVSGTIGMIVRSLEQGRPPEKARGIVKDLDEHGLYMTSALYEQSLRLIDIAAEREQP